MAGLFITMEGPDGSGKSTQIALLKQYLEKKGYETVLSREPGGTAISEKIRDVILDRENAEMGYRTEALLYAAARAQLVEEVILPALDAGKAVICDRFVDSSAVYQGIGRSLGIEEVYRINEYAIRGIMPDVTFLLDLDAAEGLRRKRNQAELDRMESESQAFHEAVAEGYRMLARKYPDRIKRIDGSASIAEIHEQIIRELP